jgi:signal peptidase I
MRLADHRSTAVLVVFVVVVVLFAYGLLTYTRRVESTSMLPALEPGDLVVIQSVPISDVHVGDIIVYNPPCSATGASVIHRVVEVEKTGLITQGDNNPGTDIQEGIATSPIEQSCLVGKVVFVIPYIERLATLPYGANYVLAALVVLVAVLYEISGGSKQAGDTEGPEKAQQGGLPADLRIPAS